MAFQKFGKFIFPVVATVFSLDILSSVFNDSYYDISFQQPKHLMEDDFAHSIKNTCISEVQKLSIEDILIKDEYIEYFLNNHLDVRRSFYFPTRGCTDNDSFNRKGKEAEDYLEKNIESLQKSYHENLEAAKKYVFADDSYEVTNHHISVNYDHNYYKESGKVNVKIYDIVSVFKIKEVAGKPLEQTKLYIKPTNRQLDFISKSDGLYPPYKILVNIKLDSLKTFGGKECRVSSLCIATNLVKAEMVIVKRNKSEKESERWILIDTIPVEWE